MKRSITDDAILFGAFRVYAVEAAIKQPRFISFVWTGRAAPLKSKVAASNIKAAALKWFDVRGACGAGGGGQGTGAAGRAEPRAPTHTRIRLPFWRLLRLLHPLPCRAATWSWSCRRWTT